MLSGELLSGLSKEQLPAREDEVNLAVPEVHAVC